MWPTSLSAPIDLDMGLSLPARCKASAATATHCSARRPAGPTRRLSLSLPAPHWQPQPAWSSKAATSPLRTARRRASPCPEPPPEAAPLPRPLLPLQPPHTDYSSKQGGGGHLASDHVTRSSAAASSYGRPPTRTRAGRRPMGERGVGSPAPSPPSPTDRHQPANAQPGLGARSERRPMGEPGRRGRPSAEPTPPIGGGGGAR